MANVQRPVGSESFELQVFTFCQSHLLDLDSMYA